jgi:histidine ammonia-lyase
MTRPSSAKVVLDGRSLTVFDVVHAARDGHAIELADAAWDAAARGRACVEASLREGGRAYGVTTGVGSQKDHPLGPDELASFNRRLLVAHATVASQQVLAPQIVRAALVVQLNQLATGASGIRPTVIEALLERYNAGAMPRANVGASVGASDLVPLAQMALSILGVSNPLDELDPVDPVDPLDGAPRDFPPHHSVSLSVKEALSLMNSNAVSLGHGALVLLRARKLLRGFDLAAAMALEGFRGNPNILDDAVLAAHRQPGQAIATAHMRRLLDSSGLWAPDAPRHLQDPLSFRCAPQVHGAVYSALEWVWHSWELEMNMVQDNPVVDVTSGRLVSNGNMDGTLLTLGMDTLRAALATAVDISAQRLHKLHWPAFSGLPAGLAHTAGPLGGVQFLNLSHIAEAHAAMVRARARPALLNYQGQLADGVEDHATLLPLSVSETDALIDAAWVVQALELTVAAWAVRRRGVPADQLGRGLKRVFAEIEPRLPIGREGDEVFDLRPIVKLVADEDLVDLIDHAAPPVPDFEPLPVEA